MTTRRIINLLANTQNIFGDSKKLINLNYLTNKSIFL